MGEGGDLSTAQIRVAPAALRAARGYCPEGGLSVSHHSRLALCPSWERARSAGHVLGEKGHPCHPPPASAGPAAFSSSRLFLASVWAAACALLGVGVR